MALRGDWSLLYSLSEEEYIREDSCLARRKFYIRPRHLPIRLGRPGRLLEAHFPSTISPLPINFWQHRRSLNDRKNEKEGQSNGTKTQTESKTLSDE